MNYFEMKAGVDQLTLKCTMGRCFYAISQTNEHKTQQVCDWQLTHPNTHTLYNTGMKIKKSKH